MLQLQKAMLERSQPLGEPLFKEASTLGIRCSKNLLTLLVMVCCLFSAILLGSVPTHFGGWLRWSIWGPAVIMPGKRRATGELTKDSYEGEEERIGVGEGTGTWQKASAEKLKTRRIVRAGGDFAKTFTVTAKPFVNPFSGIQLTAPPAAKTGTVANLTSPSTTPSVSISTLDHSIVAPTLAPANSTSVAAAPISFTRGQKRVLVPIADDSEEIEAVSITDILTRAGAQVVVASVMDHLKVRMSRGLKIEADCMMEDCKGQEFDAIVCPGGMPGAEHLRDCKVLTDLLKHQSSKGKVVAAICASPAVVLQHHGLLSGSATCYPSSKFAVPEWKDEQVVVHGHVITGQGPGASLQFALKIVEQLYGLEKAAEVANVMLMTKC